jgi:hypothetical protein
MNRLATFVSCVTYLLISGHGTSAEETLHVMLQGGSAGELRSLVEKNGGRISHDLPIIDSVGAFLTPGQLETVLESPLVTRHIDDLLVREHEPETSPDAAADCEVGGALQLDVQAHHIAWTLFNNGETVATPAAMELEWPGALGRVTEIMLGGRPIGTTLTDSSDVGELSIKIQDAAPISRSKSASLEVSFEHRPDRGIHTIHHQNDFALAVDFAENCSATLVPAYEDNHGDFHYATVSGAAALHHLGITGRGVNVAVLDSGLWETEALALDTRGKPRIVARYDAMSDSAGKEVFDESGHGTHMSSVIAHNGPTIVDGKHSGSFKGIAPDVGLIAVKAFDVEGQGDMLDIVRGIQWVVDNREKYAIRVLNLSFASRPRWDYWLDPINQAVMRAWAEGIAVVAAAGNEGPEDMTIGSPGNLPYVITVGAFTDSWTTLDRNDDYIPDFSSRGPTPNAHIKPDIVAPGGHITGVTRPGSTITIEHPEYALRSGEFVMTGSSQAAALVSGIVALLLQLEPELAPDDIKCKLTSSAEPAINRDGLLAYSPFVQGHGQVNARRAVTLGETGCGNSDLNIDKDLLGIEHYQGPAIVDEEGTVSLPGLRHMVSPTPSPDGHSASRRWGVKAHIEREDPPLNEEELQRKSPFDWIRRYEQEKSRIEELARKPR